jgi:lipopolysaccharide export system protein LptA
VPPGTPTLTLGGDVEASQGGMTVRAENVVLARGSEGRLESVTATPSVTGTARAVGGGSAGFVAHEVRAIWDGNGTMASISLTGGARVQQLRGTIAADRIEARAEDPEGTLALSAWTQVVASGPTSKGVGVLSCDALRGTVDPKGTGRRRNGHPRGVP